MRKKRLQRKVHMLKIKIICISKLLKLFKTVQANRNLLFDQIDTEFGTQKPKQVDKKKEVKQERAQPKQFKNRYYVFKKNDFK